MIIDRRSLLMAGGGLASLAALGGCVAHTPLSGGRDMTLVTFNIWHDAGDWAARLPLLVDALRRTDADVIALQEVLQNDARGLANQADTIAAMLGGYSVHFYSFDPPGSAKRYGNAILTRLPVLEESGRRLDPESDYRTALRLRLSLTGRPVDVVVTHLASQSDAGAVRRRQIDDLLGWVPRDGTPLVVTGDFNAELADPELAPMAPPRFASALPTDTVTTTLNPAKGHSERVIDHIYVERDRWRVIDATRIGDKPVDGEYPSDHFGVSARLRLV